MYNDYGYEAQETQEVYDSRGVRAYDLHDVKSSDDLADQDDASWGEDRR